MDAKTELFALLDHTPEGVDRLENAAREFNIYGMSPFRCIYGHVLQNNPGDCYSLWNVKTEITGKDEWSQLEDFAVGFYKDNAKQATLLGWIAEWRLTQVVPA